MKKMMVFMFLLLAVFVNAQDNKSSKGIEELTFFGVDFSQAKVLGADETLSQFKEAFTGINNLFLREPKKYDTAKAFNAKVKTDLEPSLSLIDGITKDGLFTLEDNYSLSEQQIAGQLAKLNTGDTKGYGAVIIAGLLDKGKNRGTLNVVVFDITTKEIILNRQFTERARGFGLRNFWAYPVYKTLGKVKKIKITLPTNTFSRGPVSI
ncbi:MAG: hypothetical protein LUD46_02130 [Parabacteroides sp.]|nr:hypothetical protein [Parabacteroides sp.]